MYAAQLFHAAHQALPALVRDIAKGNLSALFDWLCQNVWQHGSRFPVGQLIRHASDEDFDPAHFRRHLETRYL